MSVEEKVHHPIAARMIEKALRSGEARGQAEHRRRLLVGLSGRVVEVGAGSGINFGYYPSSVREVVAVEPESYLRGLAEKAAERAPVPVHVLDGVSGHLPLEEASCDAGVVCLVLCSVPDQRLALAELARVIRPGGELRFYEHVVSQRPLLARLQRLADATIWPWLAGGCHLGHDTLEAIQRAGYRIESCERFPFSPSALLPPDPHVLGVARR
jgi:ubiquinone/menaquinone biosynthesis C-methylase UbiE